MKTAFLLLFILIIHSCSSDSTYNYKLDLVKLKSKNQKMLDSGDKMMNTERQFMVQTDSFINLIYSTVLKSNKYNKIKLRKEQDQFIIERQKIKDSLIQIINDKYSAFELASQDERMIYYAEIAELNYKRAIELNNLIQK